MNESSNVGTGDDSLDAVLKAAYSVLGDSDKPASPLPTLERFEILDSLGSGGMGDVFRATDRVLGRTVAIKTIRSERRLDEEARSRLLREARILSQFQHPSICRLYDYLPRDSADVLVLEYIEGTTLGDWVRAGQPRRELLRVLIDVASALEVAHRAGVVHRDLKPANIMVSASGATKVLDFGIAREASTHEGQARHRGGGTHDGPLDEDSTPLGTTEPGRVVGTLQYMSPEQARGEEASAPSDLYSLGIIMQELLSGQPVRSRTTLNALRERGAVGDPLNLPRRTERTLRRLIEGLRTDDLNARPSATDVREGLERLLRRPLRIALSLVGLGIVAAGVLFGFIYVRDLGAERDRVLGRQQQAERLISFLLDGVAPRILEVGPRALMDDVNARALEYFQAVDVDEYTDSEWQQRSEAVAGIAERVRETGDLEGAHRIHRDELRAIERRLARDPSDIGWLFRRGQAEFYVGQALRDLGDLKTCRVHWQNYLDVSETLAEMDSASVLYADELAYARTNIGVLEVEEHRPAQALEQFAGVARHWEERCSSRTTGPEALEWADAVSYVGGARGAQADFSGAVKEYGRELEIRTQLLAQDPANRTIQHGLALAHLHRSKMERCIGQGESALDDLAIAADHLGELIEADPKNTPWQRSLALVLMSRAALLDELERYDQAATVHGKAVGILEALIELDPDNGDWRHLHDMGRTAELENRVARQPGEKLEPVLSKWLAVVGANLDSALERTLLRVRTRIMIGDLTGGASWEGALAELESIVVPGGDRLLWRRIALLELRLHLRLGSMDAARDIAMELMALGPIPGEVGREWADRTPSRRVEEAPGAGN